MKHIVVFLLSLVFPFLSIAEEHEGKGWYMGVGYIDLKINVDPTLLRNAESQIDLNPKMSSSSSIKNESMTKELTLGLCINRYFCGEISGVDNMEFNANLNISGSNLGVITINGMSVDMGRAPINTSMQVDVRISAMRYSLLGRYPATDSLDVFARLGVYDYRAKLTSRVLLSQVSQNVYLAYESIETGRIPTAGLGVDWAAGKNVKFRVEYFGIGDIFALTSASVIYLFP